MNELDVLSTHDVARVCGVTPRTALRWVDAGVLHGHVTGGGRRRIRRDDLVRFMRSKGMPIPRELWATRRRVAIFDADRAWIAALQGSLLEDYPLLDVQGASDGFSAGALLFGFRPDLVFTDLVLPGLDGFDVCRRMRAEPALAGVGLVIVSARLSEPYRQRLMELGADDVLGRPPRRAALDEALARFVPEGRESAAAK